MNAPVRLETFDLNLLIALEALLDECSVTAAAARMNVSQPTMSGMLRRLRDLLGDDLLRPAGRNLVPTARGEALRPPLRDVLDLIRGRILPVPSFDPATSDRKLVIQSSDYTTVAVLARAIGAVALLAPHLRFEILAPSRLNTQPFERSEVDLFVSLEKHRVVGHPERTLMYDDFSVIFAADQRARFATMDEDQFFASGHAVVKIDAWRYPTAEAWLNERFPGRRRIEVECPSYHDLPPLLAGTARVAVVQSAFARYFCGAFPIGMTRCPLPIPASRHIVQWHRSNAADPAILWMVEQIARHCVGQDAAAVTDTSYREIS